MLKFIQIAILTLVILNTNTDFFKKCVQGKKEKLLVTILLASKNVFFICLFQRVCYCLIVIKQIFHVTKRVTAKEWNTQQKLGKQAPFIIFRNCA